MRISGANTHFLNNAFNFCEKVFPVHSPSIVSVETVRRGKVRRAKLYYLRERVGKRAKVKERL